MSRQEPDLRFGSFLLSVRNRRLARDGETVPLTPKAFETLLCLLSSDGAVVEKQALMKSVWGDVFGNRGMAYSTYVGFRPQDSIFESAAVRALALWPCPYILPRVFYGEQSSWKHRCRSSREPSCRNDVRPGRDRHRFRWLFRNVPISVNASRTSGMRSSRPYCACDWPS